MSEDYRDQRAAAFDHYRDAVAILKAVTTDDAESFTVIVQHCDTTAVIHGLATMLMAGLWQLADENLDSVIDRIDWMQQRLRQGGGDPA